MVCGAAAERRDAIKEHLKQVTIRQAYPAALLLCSSATVPS